MYSDLLDNRAAAYEALFLGELPYNPQPDEADIGLSGLWRVHTPKRGRNGDELNYHLDTIPSQVYGLLLEHDIAAHNPDEPVETIFGLLDPKTTLPIISNITSQALTLWEKALWRNQYGPVVSTNGTNPVEAGGVEDAAKERLANLLAKKSLVIETAAAAMWVLPIFSRNALQPTRKEQADLAKILANWGPQFLVEWMDGSIITRWLDSLGITQTEKQDLLSTTFTPAIRKYLAVHNITDPLAALDRVKTNLDLLNDNQTLAERLGWSETEVTATFTPTIRKYLAVNNITDPLAALDRVKANLDLLNDNQALAERLGWSETEVAATFTPAIRKYLAVSNITDPLVGAEDYIYGKIKYQAVTIYKASVKPRPGLLVNGPTNYLID